MKDLKITKGGWEVLPNQRLSGLRKIVVKGKNTITLVATDFGSDDELEADAKLIADAGTTANKCGLLPSELLEQRNELLDALKRVEKSINEQDLNSRFGHTILYVREAIIKAQGE